MAEVVNIRTLNLNELAPELTFAVDTNILLFRYYNRLSRVITPTSAYQLEYYPTFIDLLFENQYELCTTVINLAEYCSVIERKEFEIYRRARGNSHIFFKTFRNNHRQREAYQRRVRNGLEAITHDMTSVFQITQTQEGILNFSQAISSMKCDVSDFTFIEYLKSIGVTHIISDDGDLATIDGITLYTANLQALNHTDEAPPDNTQLQNEPLRTINLF